MPILTEALGYVPLHLPPTPAIPGALPGLRRHRRTGPRRPARRLAAHKADAYLARLGAYLQATPQYRDKTSLLITTDHGRDRGRQWQKHGLQIPGSGQTWLAVLGPDTPATGEQRGRGQLHQNQVAQTLAQLLGVPYVGGRPTGRAIASALAHQ